MTTGRAEMAVATSAFVTFACVTGNKVLSGGLPSGRQVAATFVAFGALATLASGAPDIAGGLAIAVGGTAFAMYGLPLADRFGFDPYNKKGNKS